MSGQARVSASLGISTIEQHLEQEDGKSCEPRRFRDVGVLRCGQARVLRLVGALLKFVSSYTA
jgi:hypothetical protein